MAVFNRVKLAILLLILITMCQTSVKREHEMATSLGMFPILWGMAC